MEFRNIISATVRTIAYIAFALILFIFGLVGVLYSPWAQNIARVALVNKLDGSDGTRFLKIYLSLL